MSQRNPGQPFNMDLVLAAETAPPAASYRLDGQDRVSSLLRVVRCLDLTSLEGNETRATIEALCARARHPVIESLTVAAVCIYPAFVPAARNALSGSGVLVATVAAGFPSGTSPMNERLREITSAVAAGADEIDVVIKRAHALKGAWRELYDEIRAMRDACGDRLMKVILGTGELETIANVARASRVALMAGADFLKTSTGKEAVNATLPAGAAMAREIRWYERETGHAVGLKPAGGIRTAAVALDWLALARAELGDRWLSPSLFRIGASSLLDDIGRELALHRLSTV